jgi:hypothetical protein
MQLSGILQLKRGEIYNDWNRRRQATSNLGVQLILAADPKEHQHLVGGEKGRYLFVTSMLKSTMTQK